jgi:pimeloyl-ACP methyl ester carboxylesterase
MKRAGKIFLALVIIYLITGIELYFAQDLIIFDPTAVSKDYIYSFDQPYEEINLPFNNHNLNIVKFRVQNRKGIVLFFHGKTENVEHYKKYPSFFVQNNYELWMMDYPGFGKSTGERTEKIIDDEALLMYNLASQEISTDSIVIYGKSLGTGVASYLAANRSCKQLILETPYYSLSSLAKHYAPIYPVNLLIKYSLPTHDYLKKIRAPITIFHGTDDQLIPFKHSKWLKEENNKIKLVVIEKGKHNNLSDFLLYRSTLDSLLQY